MRHRRLGGLTLAYIHIIWGGHGLPHNIKPGLRKHNSHPLTKFLDPVAQFSKKLNRISNEADFVWYPHLEDIPFSWIFSDSYLLIKSATQSQTPDRNQAASHAAK